MTKYTSSLALFFLSSLSHSTQGFLSTPITFTHIADARKIILSTSQSVKKASESRGMAEDDTSSSSSSSVPFATIIGAGRIGSMLAENGDCLVLKRGDTLLEDGKGPIFIATRNDALDGIVESTPENRRKDLMFLQNGYLDGFLVEKCLADNPQCLLFVAVSSLGAEPIDGITSVNPEGLTSATGEHAVALQARLNAAGMKCNILSPDDYKPAMFEKLIWIATYMLVGTAKECATVGQAGKEHGELVEQVITELVTAVTTKEGIKFKEGTVERLKAYTDVVTSFPW